VTPQTQSEFEAVFKLSTGNGKPLRCDVCGRFIAWGAFFDGGRATRELLTPDSECSREEYETLYPKHAEAAECDPIRRQWARRRYLALTEPDHG
jgi:hypothetical protein